MVVVDVHAHFYPPSYLELLRSLVTRDDDVGELARFALSHAIDDPIFSDLSVRVPALERAGLVSQILSFSSPNIWTEDRGLRCALVEAFNDGCHDATEASAGGFWRFAALPLPFVENAIAEAERATESLGAVGIGLPTNVNGRPIDDPSFDPLWGFLNETTTAVFFHPDTFCAKGVLEDHRMDWLIGAPFEDTIVVTRLLFGRLTQRFPDIRWIVPHLGGATSMVLARLDTVWQLQPHFQKMLPVAPSRGLGSIWFDTAGADAKTIAAASDILGRGRLLFGTDFPYMNQEIEGAVAALREGVGADGEDVTTRNAFAAIPGLPGAQRSAAHRSQTSR